MDKEQLKILAISDEESKGLWDYYDPQKLKDVDLILSCGDLDSDYLQFLVTMTNLPLLYVHGNHDQHYKRRPPDGCICIEDKVYNHKGIRILGLGGSVNYNDGPHQFSQGQMAFRMFGALSKIAVNGGVDILLTHSPAAGINEGEDRAHKGFKAFNVILNQFKPKYFIHGHVHLNVHHGDRITAFGETTVINAYENYLFDY